jgi:NAD(P)-dependent dehydrogenase (short-subunit alcohol dehydrogenase family)
MTAMGGLLQERRGPRRLLFAALVVVAWTAAMAEEDYRPTVLITGASRGIGLEFARQFADRDWRVLATVRDAGGARDLRELAATHPNVIVEPMDVADAASVAALAAKYAGQPIDLLLLNAAVGPDLWSATSPLAKLDFEQAQRSFEVNAIGPMRVCQAFMDNVAASRRRQIVAMSSDSASFEAGSQKPILYNYKASKAALNMYLHTLAFETPRRGVTLVMLHPGLVGTNALLARFPGALRTDHSVALMLTVIDGLTPADNGRFLDHAGRSMPW